MRSQRVAPYVCALSVIALVSTPAYSQRVFDLREWNQFMLAGRAAADSLRLTEADQNFSSAVSMTDDSGRHNILLARSLVELAAVRELTGRFPDAVRLVTRSIGILGAAPDSDPAELATAWEGLGHAHLGIGTYASAVRAFLRALEITAALKTTPVAEVIATLSGLSAAYRAQHRYRDAEAALTRAQAIQANTPNADPWVDAFLLTSLGNLYLWEHRFPQAEAALLRGQSLLENPVGPAHKTEPRDDAAAAYLTYNLASLYLRQKRYRESETLFAKSLAHAEKGVPVLQADMARILQGYARSLQKLGHKDDAKRLEAKAQALGFTDRSPNELQVDVTALKAAGKR
jgi:tetratricopeptide (TPR) repeat protein